jgi:hypothetical protein
MAKVDSYNDIKAPQWVRFTKGAPVDCEEESQGCNGFLTPRQLLHVSESLHRWHGMILDATKVRLL